MENTSFDELLAREGIEPARFTHVLDVMEAVEIMATVSRLGDRVLDLMSRGELTPGRGEGLLNELFDAARNPIGSTERLAEIRKELKEHGK